MLSILALDYHQCPVSEISIDGAKNLDKVKTGLFGMDIGIMDYIVYKGMRKEMCDYGGGIREYDVKFICEFIKTLDFVSERELDSMLTCLSNPIKTYRVAVFEGA